MIDPNPTIATLVNDDGSIHRTVEVVVNTSLIREPVVCDEDGYHTHEWRPLITLSVALPPFGGRLGGRRNCGFWLRTRMIRE